MLLMGHLESFAQASVLSWNVLGRKVCLSYYTCDVMMWWRILHMDALSLRRGFCATGFLFKFLFLISNADPVRREDQGMKSHPSVGEYLLISRYQDTHCPFPFNFGHVWPVSNAG